MARMQELSETSDILRLAGPQSLVVSPPSFSSPLRVAFSSEARPDTGCAYGRGLP